MFGSYLPDDVEILLKDITGLVEPLPASEREPLIQRGVHYCEMLPLEYVPTGQYMRLFEDALTRYAAMTADAVAAVSGQIIRARGEHAVLVSLARAGTPVGILIKRYIKMRYGYDVPHYTVSIIRGRGIDKNAMDFILSKHSAREIQFVDGWTGKGAIQRQLNEAMADYPGVEPGLAVLSDPARVAGLCGTYDDLYIASSCLNSTVSGLLSRTFLRPDLIGPGDYHGAAFYSELKEQDVTYKFIDSIVSCFDLKKNYAAPVPENGDGDGLAETEEIARTFGVRDINLVKPGIGEATRVLLRRVPWKILVRDLDDAAHLGHLYQLAKEKGVEVVQYPLRCYRACGIIQEMADT